MERALSIVEQLKLLNSLVFKPLKEEQSDYPIVPVGELVRHVLFVPCVEAMVENDLERMIRTFASLFPEPKQEVLSEIGFETDDDLTTYKQAFDHFQKKCFSWVLLTKKYDNKSLEKRHKNVFRQISKIVDLCETLINQGNVKAECLDKVEHAQAILRSHLYHMKSLFTEEPDIVLPSPEIPLAPREIYPNIKSSSPKKSVTLSDLEPRPKSSIPEECTPPGTRITEAHRHKRRRILRSSIAKPVTRVVEPVPCNSVATIHSVLSKETVEESREMSFEEDLCRTPERSFVPPYLSRTAKGRKGSLGSAITSNPAMNNPSGVDSFQTCYSQFLGNMNKNTWNE
ncbi:uncharacterized protein LOC136026912 [Artemia franciscana]